jgi:hypothetical protein
MHQPTNASGGNSGKACIELIVENTIIQSMRYFNKLPGFIKTPSGIEWILLRKLPLIFAVSAAVPVAVMLLLYFGNQTLDPEQLKTIYLCLGILFSIFFFVGAAAIGCIVVMIMKGPAYVADPYELPKENKKLEQYPNR